MARLNFVTVNSLAPELAVEGVQVEPVCAGNERERLGGVGSEFVGRARFAGIIAGGDDAAGERPAEILEAAHVIALPAVE